MHYTVQSILRYLSPIIRLILPPLSESRAENTIIVAMRPSAPMDVKDKAVLFIFTGFATPPARR